MKRVNDFIESILDRLSPEQEFNPWDQPDTPKPQVTDEEIEEAVSKMQETTRKGIHPVMVKLIQIFMLLWAIGHFALLYVMIGSPISGGILIYVLINLSISSHYFILLRKAQR